MKYRPLRPRRGLRGSRAVIRAHRPWRSWLMGVAVVVALAIGLAVWAYDAGQRMHRSPDLGGANEQLRG